MTTGRNQWNVGPLILDTDDAIDHILGSGRKRRLLEKFESDFNTRYNAASVLYAYNRDAYYDEAREFYRRMARTDPEGFAMAIGASDGAVTSGPVTISMSGRDRTPVRGLSKARGDADTIRIIRASPNGCTAFPEQLQVTGGGSE